MGQRFYQMQIAATGNCPGATNSQRRRKRVAWTDEKKAEAIKMYEDADPTPETSIEIVQSIAEELEETANGVRMVLSKAQVYIKKAAATGKKAAAAGGDTKAVRVSKEDAITTLREAIEAAGQTVDEDIIGKLTGKAALYLAGVIQGK